MNAIPRSTGDSTGGIPVAVLISVHEHADPRLFNDALNSLEEQDYDEGPVRIYLCVDGPVGGSILDVISEHQLDLHKVLSNHTNIGLATSLNRLIDSLEDERFVFRMDSDDYSHPDRIRKQVDVMLRRPEIDILGGAIREVDMKGNVLKTLRYPEQADAVRRWIPRRNPLAHPTVCFRRAAINRFGHYPETSVNQDWALWYKCLAIGLTISNIADVVVDMTVSDAFLRRRGPQRAIEEFTICLRGTWLTHRVTWRMIYPALRLVFRLAPTAITRSIYKSSLR